MTAATRTRTNAAAIFAMASMAIGVSTAQADTSKWNCERCPFQDGFTGTVKVGAAVVSDEENSFGNYTGYDEDTVYGGFGVQDFRYWGDGGYTAYVDGFGYNQDSFELTLGAGHQGKWSTDFVIDFLPVRKGQNTRTVYDNLDGTPQRLPEDWVRAGNTAGMTSLDENLRSFDVKWDRETFGLGAEYLFTPNLIVDADWRYQTKQGQGRTWGSFLGNAAELTLPLDYDTHEVDAGITYAGSNWQIRGGYYGSFFSNKNLSHTWDNPFTGPDEGRKAGAPDNKAYQFSLGGNWHFSRLFTAVANVSVGTAEQDDDFLPYTINRDIATSPLPRQSLDGEVDTTHANVKITSVPWSRLRLTGEYRYDDRDNKTDQYTYDWVSADLTPGNAPEENLPYSFERNEFDFTADYRLTSTFKASAGFSRHTIERDFQEVDENEEDTFWAKLKFRVDRVNVSLKGETADRDIDGQYEQVDFLKLAQNPLMRKYYMAERDRDGIELAVNAHPTDRLSLGARYESWDEDYDESLVGLVDADRDSYVVDASFAFRRNVSLYGSFGGESVESTQVGAQSNADPNTATPNWKSDHDDDYTTANVGFRWGGIAEKWGIEVDYVYAESEGEISLSNAGRPDEYPELETELNRARLGITYDYSRKIRFVGGVLYEKYDSDDWSVDGVEPDTLNSVLTWGGDSPDYDVTVFSLGFTYSLDKPYEP